MNQPNIKTRSLCRRPLASVFDSARSPAPTGVRAAAECVRHLTYESGQFLVDVVIEPSGRASDGLVAGQILRQLGGPIVPIPEIPALLMSRGELLATAMTSDQGGFSLSGGLGGTCELWFFLEDERVLGVTWDQDEEPVTKH